MKLLTHNLLRCLKCSSYPLRIKPDKIEQTPHPPNHQFILHMIPKLNYQTLLLAAQDLKISGLPNVLPDNIKENIKALESLHKLLLEVEIIDGCLYCENCKREYMIKDKIANFVLRDDEVDEIKKIKKDLKKKERLKNVDEIMNDKSNKVKEKEKKKEKKDNMDVDG